MKSFELRVNKVGRCERFVLNTLFLLWLVCDREPSRSTSRGTIVRHLLRKTWYVWAVLINYILPGSFYPFFVVPKNIHTHLIVDFLDINCSFASYYCFKIVFQVRPPFTLEFSVTLLRAGMDIFWNHTLLWNLLQELGCWSSLNVCLLFSFFFPNSWEKTEGEERWKKSRMVPA